MNFESDTINLRDIPRKSDFFRTPRQIADRMIDEIGIGQRAILEPSAGDGAIVRALLRCGANPSDIYCVELDEKMADGLINDLRVKVESCDFMQYDPSGYGIPNMKFQRIFMTPPMHDGLDVIHTTKAYDLLERPGAMAAVVSEDAFLLHDHVSVAFREMINRADDFRVFQLSDNEFNGIVQARLVILYKH